MTLLMVEGCGAAQSGWNTLRTLLVMLALVFSLSCGEAEDHARTVEMAAGKPNILLIAVDTLRADHLGAYGYARPTSPFIDRLAEEGVLFTRAQSNSSYTRESVASYLSGLLPSRNGARGWDTRLSSALPNMVELLKAAGYHTGFVSDQPAIKLPRFVEGLGFDHIRHISTQYYSRRGGYVTERAIEFAKRGRKSARPYFLYVHYLDPHGPYSPPPAVRGLLGGPAPLADALTLGDVRKNVSYLRRKGFGPGGAQYEDMIARYDGEILHVDRSIEDMLAELGELGLLDDTLVILISDHGEEFMEHGSVDHAWTLYQEVLHVPFVLWYPSRLEPARIHERVSLLDLLPTVLAVADLPRDDLELDGQSLLRREGDGFEVATEGLADRPIVSQLLIQERSILHAVVRGDLKYIATKRWVEPGERYKMARNRKALTRGLRQGSRKMLDLWGEDIRTEVYDLRSDPTEQRNVFDSASPEQIALQEALEEVQRASVTRESPEGETPSGMTEDLSDEERKQLEALGYR